MNVAEFFQAVQGVFTFVLIGCLGYYLSKKGWFNEDSTSLLTRLVTMVSIPFLLLYHLDASFTRDDLASLSTGGLLSLLSQVATLLVGLAVAWAIRVPSARHGIFVDCFTFSNTLNIGIPINLALFGAAAIPYVLLYYLGSTVLFWSAGYYLLIKDIQTESARLPLARRLRNLIPPPMIATVAGLALIFFDIRLPGLISEASRHVGSLTTPLVMITIGIILSGMSMAQMRFGLETWLIVVGRFLISPGIVLLLNVFFDVPPVMLRVFLIQSSLPAMTTVAMLARLHNSDVTYATKIITLTTLMAIGTVPLYMLIMPG